MTHAGIAVTRGEFWLAAQHVMAPAVADTEYNNKDISHHPSLQHACFLRHLNFSWPPESWLLHTVTQLPTTTAVGTVTNWCYRGSECKHSSFSTWATCNARLKLSAGSHAWTTTWTTCRVYYRVDTQRRRTCGCKKQRACRSFMEANYVFAEPPQGCNWWELLRLWAGLP